MIFPHFPLLFFATKHSKPRRKMDRPELLRRGYYNEARDIRGIDSPSTENHRKTMGNHRKMVDNHSWLVVTGRWIFHFTRKSWECHGNGIVIPIDELIFFRGGSTTNHWKDWGVTRHQEKGFHQMKKSRKWWWWQWWLYRMKNTDLCWRIITTSLDLTVDDG